MQVLSNHYPNRHVNAEENLAFCKEDGIVVLVARGSFHRQALNVHIDYPFDLKEFSENSVLEGKTQLYFSSNNVL